MVDIMAVTVSWRWGHHGGGHHGGGGHGVVVTAVVVIGGGGQAVVVTVEDTNHSAETIPTEILGGFTRWAPGILVGSPFINIY